MNRQIAKIHFLLYISLLFIPIGCDKRSKHHAPKTSDTLYTEQKALSIYGYQPELALRIIDSAVVVGNLSETRADLNRASIYSQTLMGSVVDSLLGGPEGVRFDSARIIGERLLRHQDFKEDLVERQNILEILTSTARRQSDTVRWLLRSRQLVCVCHQQGAETEALRTEAEIGAALCAAGKQKEGMALLDSVITRLKNGPTEMETETEKEDYQFRFNELDATIIALKRKISVLTVNDQHAEIIPLARHIIDLLDDYENNPDRYHDGTYREPHSDTDRADYIHFYRTKAEGYLTAAYALLGERVNMEETYELIERSVREATAREHIARYQILEQKMLHEKAEHHSQLMTMLTLGSIFNLFLILLFTAYTIFQNRQIKMKNRKLVRLIENDKIRMKNKDCSFPSEEGRRKENPENARKEDNHSVFHHIDQVIRTERLYANPYIQRQDVCELFNLRRDVLSQLITSYTDAQSFPAYINSIRLSEACRLLSEQPEKTVNVIAKEVGLSPRNFRRIFVETYGITPTEYRQELQGEPPRSVVRGRQV